VNSNSAWSPVPKGRWNEDAFLHPNNDDENGISTLFEKVTVVSSSVMSTTNQKSAKTKELQDLRGCFKLYKRARNR
jgi:hypothetical protein